VAAFGVRAGIAFGAGAAAIALAGVADAALVDSDERAAIRMAVPTMHTTMRPIAAVRLPVKRMDFFEAIESPPQGV